jgi:ABC-type transporter Mla MlaB component
LSEVPDILMDVGGRIALPEIPALCDRMHAMLERVDAELVVCDVGALADIDLVTVAALARLKLTARRLGCGLSLRHPSRELEELLAFVGLADVLLEPSGKAEEREQVRGVEEEADPADPAAC